MKKNEAFKRWEAIASKLLVGKKIVAVKYMDEEEQDALGWHASAIVLKLDDGTLLYPSSDDEGNDAGALFTTDDTTPTLPVI